MKNKLIILTALTFFAGNQDVSAESERVESQTMKINDGTRAVGNTEMTQVLNSTSVNDIKTLIVNTAHNILDGDIADASDYIVKTDSKALTVVTDDYTELDTDDFTDLSKLSKPFLTSWESKLGESFYDSLDEYKMDIKITGGNTAQLVTSEGTMDIPLVKVPGTINNAYYLKTTKSEAELNRSFTELATNIGLMESNSMPKDKAIGTVISKILKAVS